MASNTSPAIERIAADIGAAVYIDVAKWHLYLRDAHLHTPLAEALYPMLAEGNLNRSDVESTLNGTMVQLGGGKKTLTLLELIPMTCIDDLMAVLEDCQQDL